MVVSLLIVLCNMCEAQNILNNTSLLYTLVSTASTQQEGPGLNPVWDLPGWRLHVLPVLCGFSPGIL